MTTLTPYNPLPIAFTHGQGVWLWDEHETQYLDALAGIAVCSLGHCHPQITQTICDQAKQLLHTSNTYHIANQEALATRLAALTNSQQVFFANSGAEANEAAIKLARLYGHERGIDAPAIIVMEGALHGRTMATLTASGSRKVQAGFEPLVPGFIRAPYNDIEAIVKISQQCEEVVAILVEPIQGEGGVHVASDEYLTALREICDQQQWLLMIDEVQTGMGRTGEMFGYQHAKIQPDVVTLAKALGNGVPIGACLMHGKAATLFKPGKHGSTFGGNPLSTAAALTVLDIMEQEDLVLHVQKISTYLMAQLQQHIATNPLVKNIRGKGLMIGIELSIPAREALFIGLKNQILFGVTADQVIRLLPPLVITKDEIDVLVSRLQTTLQEFANNQRREAAQ